MEEKKTNKISVVGTVFVLCAGIFIFGIYVGYNRRPDADKVIGVLNKNVPNEISADFSPFWKAWRVIDEKYAFLSTSTDLSQKKVWGAIQGMTNSLGDPYTTFFPPEETKSFNEEISGSFEGIGMEVGLRDGVLTAISPLKGSPAEKAGMLPGDKILKIDETFTTDFTVEKAVKIIRGPQGTKVKLLISRVGIKEPFEVSIIRDTIQTPTVDIETKDDIFIIKLYSFSATSPDLFRDALREFILSGKEKLIVDLRGNPGGYLEASVYMASWFLPTGKVIVREDFGKNKDQVFYRSKGFDVFNDNLKLVILVDGGSASASEIFAGALHDHKIATLIGEKTFGKGSVQELVKITENTSLKVTIAKWLTPNGISINESGLMPDIEVKRTLADVEKKRDPQMDRAIKFLNKE